MPQASNNLWLSLHLEMFSAIVQLQLYSDGKLKIEHNNSISGYDKAFISMFIASSAYCHLFSEMVAFPPVPYQPSGTISLSQKTQEKDW